MTIVIARRFGERIIILSDTMVTDPNQPRPDIVPGQLKAVVINLQISIAYAGYVAIGIKAARSCRDTVSSGGGLLEIIEILKNHSEEGFCDFLVASHENGPEIFKIKGGVQSKSQNAHWIGDTTAVSQLNDISLHLEESVNLTRRQDQSLVDFRTGETRFCSAFNHLFLTSIQVTNKVGGLAVCLLGSPFGHCYQQHAGSYLPGSITIGGPSHPQAVPARGNRYSYNFLASKYRGVAVAGAYFDDAKFGLIYNPIVADKPKLLHKTSMQAVIDEIDMLAGLNGGKLDHEC